MNSPANTWIHRVKPGSMLDIRPFWNLTERGPSRINSPCKVLAVTIEPRGCQSGVMFTVLTAGGSERMLDAAWFHEPVSK